jgi:hypothetical protein
MTEKIYMRQRIFEIIEVSKNDDKASAGYDIFMQAGVITAGFMEELNKNKDADEES